MKQHLLFISFILSIFLFPACRSTKKLNTAIAKKDTVIVSHTGNTSLKDSLKRISDVMDKIRGNRIDYKTFSAKIKVNYEDSKGKKPDVVVFVRNEKDNVMWLSVNASFLSIEAFRVLITKDSVFILNKLDKIYETHSLDYIQDIAKIPLDFKTLQDLIVGNPVFLDTNVVSYVQTENRILLSTVGKFFKNLITISSGSNLMEKSKLDDIDPARNRTADLTYGEYESKNGVSFATAREISVSEKTKVDIILDFKQWDFNKELTYPFSVPKNYKKK